MAKKKKAAPKVKGLKKRGRGRPSKGPTVSITLSMSKDLVDSVDRLQKKVSTLRSRTATIEAAVRAGLEREEAYWKSLDS